MRGVVDPGQMLKIQMRVYLRGADISVAEQLLYRAQVAAGFQDMSGERMAQHVRVDVSGESLFDGPIAQALLHGAGADAPAAPAHEQRRLIICRQFPALL